MFSLPSGRAGASFGRDRGQGIGTDFCSAKARCTSSSLRPWTAFPLIPRIIASTDIVVRHKPRGCQGLAPIFFETLHRREPQCWIVLHAGSDLLSQRDAAIRVPWRKLNPKFMPRASGICCAGCLGLECRGKLHQKATAETGHMANILIMGASRGIGFEAVNEALAAGHIVRALARTAHRIPVDHSNLQKIDGDALDPVVVHRALAGIDIVIQSIGFPVGPELIFRPVRLFSDATRILVAAMKKAGSKRLICVTGFGAGDSRGRGGLLYDAAFCLFLGRVYEDKDVQERIISRSGLQWTIVRPVILTNGPKTGAYRALSDPRDWRCGFISRADVADFLIKQIDENTFVGATPVLSG